MSMLGDDKKRFLDAAKFYAQAVEEESAEQWYWRGELESAAVNVEFTSNINIGADVVEFNSATRELYRAAQYFATSSNDLEELCNAALKWYSTTK
jgi:hypothetical protein